jgi:hypothetical protein
MAGDAVRHAVDRLFEWPGQDLTIEFQGGEPLLHFDRVRSITEQIVARNVSERRTLRFVLASTLHDLTMDQLAFFKEHRFARWPRVAAQRQPPAPGARQLPAHPGRHRARARRAARKSAL